MSKMHTSPRAAVIGATTPPAATAPVSAPETTPAAAPVAPPAKKAKRARKIDPATGKPVKVSPEERRARALAKWAKSAGLTSVIDFIPVETREKIAAVAATALKGERVADALIKRAAKVRADSATAVVELDGFRTRLLAVRAQVEEASRAAILRAAGVTEATGPAL